MQPGSAVHILIADDHHIMREGIKALLANYDDLEVVAEADNGKETISILENDSSAIDLILMDIQMPEMNGLEATKYISQNFPHIKILALTIFDDEPHVVEMLRSGAAGYVLKTTDTTHLAQCIKRVMGNESCVSQEVSEILIDHVSKRKSKNVLNIHLTKREIEILELITKGYTNNEMANKLYVSPRTVGTHRRNLLQKLNMKNTAELVRYALEHELV